MVTLLPWSPWKQGMGPNTEAVPSMVAYTHA